MLKDCCCFAPRFYCNLAALQTLKIYRALACIVCSIEYCRNGKNLIYEIRAAAVNSAARIDYLPSQVVDERFRDCNIFLCVSGIVCRIRERCSLAVKDKIILAASVQFFVIGDKVHFFNLHLIQCIKSLTSLS